MCLLTVSDFEKALEDINVWVVREVMGDTILSPYRRFVWKLGKKYKAEGKIMKEVVTELGVEVHVITSGMFHAFTSRCKARTMKRDISKMRYGIYNYKRTNIYIYKAVIPKGSKIIRSHYYKEIAGTHMILKERVY